MLSRVYSCYSYIITSFSIYCHSPSTQANIEMSALNQAELNLGLRDEVYQIVTEKINLTPAEKRNRKIAIGSSGTIGSIALLATIYAWKYLLIQANRILDKRPAQEQWENTVSEWEFREGEKTLGNICSLEYPEGLENLCVWKLTAENCNDILQTYCAARDAESLFEFKIILAVAALFLTTTSILILLRYLTFPLTTQYDSLEAFFTSNELNQLQAKCGQLGIENIREMTMRDFIKQLEKYGSNLQMENSIVTNNSMRLSL